MACETVGNHGVRLTRFQRLSAVAVAAAVVAVAPASARAANVESGVIRDGVGVAGVRLGMTPADVRRKLGPPASQNATPDGRVVYMSYHESEIFGVYFDEAAGRVRMLIVAVQSGRLCTGYGACLYREGDLDKIKRHYGSKLFRFTDRDGSTTYRRLRRVGGRQVMTEWTPVEERNGVAQVAILYWPGRIDDSSLD
jgi:hypothetical protein